MIGAERKRPERATAPSADRTPDTRDFPAAPLPAFTVEWVRIGDGLTRRLADARVLVPGLGRLWVTLSEGDDGTFVAPLSVRGENGQWKRSAVFDPAFADALKAEIEQRVAQPTSRDSRRASLPRRSAAA